MSSRLKDEVAEKKDTDYLTAIKTQAEEEKEEDEENDQNIWGSSITRRRRTIPCHYGRRMYRTY